MRKRTIEIDLYRDWITYLRNELSISDYDITQFPTDEEVSHAYLNLLKLRIRPVPRIILKSKSFTCPIGLLSGLANVERKIVAGEDLSPHLSTRIKNPSKNDSLLNDWGIHHIHLGTVVEDDGFVSRTGPLLFARFDNVAAYFINVLPHGSWALQSLVMTLHDNWPDSIKHFQLKDVVSMEHSLADRDITQLRKANVTTPVPPVEGVVCALIGGGITSSGLSLDVVKWHDQCARRLREMQETVIENIELIASDARKKGIELPEKVQFGVEVRDDEIYAVEINCMLGVRLGKL